MNWLHERSLYHFKYVEAEHQTSNFQNVSVPDFVRMYGVSELEFYFGHSLTIQVAASQGSFVPWNRVQTRFLLFRKSEQILHGRRQGRMLEEQTHIQKILLGVRAVEVFKHHLGDTLNLDREINP